MIDQSEKNQYLQALLRAADASGICLDQTSQKKSLRYIELLLEWNQKMNLTAITDPEGIAIRHFADSWTILPWLNRFMKESAHKPYKMIDVGTGAGFPGIPLKIISSGVELFLLDSLRKRVGFLQSVSDDLQLSDVNCMHSRAEEASQKRELRDQFDLATARAVASLPVLCELCLPFVRIDGYFIAMKSRSEAEIEQSENAVSKLGGQLHEVQNFTLPDTDIQRSLVIIKKISETPKRFPRKAGLPQREPL